MKLIWQSVFTQNCIPDSSKEFLKLYNNIGQKEREKILNRKLIHGFGSRRLFQESYDS